MRQARIVRVSSSEKSGTFGVLTVDGYPICGTLEPRWKMNKPNVSCIPAGQYVCRRVDSPTYGDTFEVTGVIDRSHILFHAGNWDHNTQGCILLGEQFGRLAGEAALQCSKQAVMDFKTVLGSSCDEFLLTIVECY